MTHRPDRIAEALELGRAGFTATKIGRRLETPRETVRDWLAGRLPGAGRDGSGCDRCGGVAHALRHCLRRIYLLGLYPGDGCVSRHPRDVFRLRVTLDLA